MARKTGKSRGRKAKAARGAQTRRAKPASAARTRRAKAGAKPRSAKAGARPRSAKAGAKARSAKATRAAARTSRPKARRATAASKVPAKAPGKPRSAAGTRRPPSLERPRRQLREVEENIPTPPSSLDLDRTPSAARSGRRGLQEARLDHPETSPVMTGGDVDADWEDAYAVGDEAPGGDNPTPDQDRVDDIGKALGVEYNDNEELKGSDKIAERDRKRWELDPASAEDYRDRDKELDEE